MYALQQLIFGHRDIVEKEYALEKLIAAISSGLPFANDAVAVADFFGTAVAVHIQIEETVLFPVLEKAVPRERLSGISERRRDHEVIKENLDQFSALARQSRTNTSEEVKRQLILACRGIMKTVIAHVREEQEILPKLVTEFCKSEHYLEIDEIYFRMMDV